MDNAVNCIVTHIEKELGVHFNPEQIEQRRIILNRIIDGNGGGVTSPTIEAVADYMFGYIYYVNQSDVTVGTIDSSPLNVKVDSIKKGCNLYGVNYVGDGSKSDLYRRMLIEIGEVFHDEEWVLYGSAALWLEGNPRPDNTPKMEIKDLDMGMLVAPKTDLVAKAEEVIGKIKNNKNLASLVAVEIVDKRFITQGGTIEFSSGDGKLQFSFNLREAASYAQVSNGAKKLQITVGKSKGTVNMNGLHFITERLSADDGLISMTLFRSDKTIKILTYICMVMGAQLHDDKNIDVTPLFEPILNRLNKMLQYSKLKSNIGRLLHFDDDGDTVDSKFAEHHMLMIENALSLRKELNKKGATDDKFYLHTAYLKYSKLDKQNKKLGDDINRDIERGVMLFIVDSLNQIEGIINFCPWISRENQLIMLDGLRVIKQFYELKVQDSFG